MANEIPERLDFKVEMFTTDMPPGSIPLDPVEVAFENVYERGLQARLLDALKEMIEQAKLQNANFLYDVHRSDVPGTYRAIYSARTCRTDLDIEE